MSFKFSDIDAVVFDMDGVIFDSESLGLRSWQIVADRYGLGDVSETSKKCIGRNTADTMKIFDEAYGDKVSIEALYEEGKIEMQKIIASEGLPLKSGVRELLDFLRAQGMRTGLASSTKQAMVKEELGSVGLLDYFSVVIGGDMIKLSKPEPEIYLLACEKLGVSPEKSVCIEDSYNGIISAHRAGLHTIMVPDLLAPTEDILKLVEVLKPSLDDVLCFFQA